MPTVTNNSKHIYKVQANDGYEVIAYTNIYPGQVMTWEDHIFVIVEDTCNLTVVGRFDYFDDGCLYAYYDQCVKSPKPCLAWYMRKKNKHITADGYNLIITTAEVKPFKQIINTVGFDLPPELQTIVQPKKYKFRAPEHNTTISRNPGKFKFISPPKI